MVYASFSMHIPEFTLLRDAIVSVISIVIVILTLLNRALLKMTKTLNLFRGIGNSWPFKKSYL